MTLPTIHMNGTGAETLRDDALAQRSAVQDLLDAMRKAEFNARDYYPVEGSWERARADRQAFADILRSASDHFMEVAEHAQKHLDEREARRNKS